MEREADWEKTRVRALKLLLSQMHRAELSLQTIRKMHANHLILMQMMVFVDPHGLKECAACRRCQKQMLRNQPQLGLNKRVLKDTVDEF